MEEEIKKEIIGKAGFPLYVDYWEKYFSQMSGEQVKECLKIIFNFNITFEVLNSDDLAVRMVINTIVDNLKRDAQKRIKQSKASRENGLLGGRPKKEDRKQQKVANLADSDIKTDSKINKFIKPTIQETTSLVKESDFEDFWQSYKPIHTAKGSKEKSKKIFFKALKEDNLENIMNGLQDYMNYCWSKNSYTKSVEVWLKNESWKDDYSNISQPATGKVAELREVCQQFLDQNNE